MQIVIDIPDNQYENLAKIVNAGKEPLGYWERVVMRGTPLPKGHGRLIDDDKLYVEMAISGDWRLTEASRFVFTQMIKNAPTIIPADKEG